MTHSEIERAIRKQVEATMNLADANPSNKATLQDCLTKLDALLERAKAEIPASELYWSNGYDCGLGELIPIERGRVKHYLQSC